jgi:hypothetical protein
MLNGLTFCSHGNLRFNAAVLARISVFDEDFILLMLSVMPGMLGRNAAASIDLNSCNEVLFEDTVIILVEVMLETLSIRLIGLMLSYSKRFV